MITTLTLLSLGCILSYTLAVCLKFKGIPASISSSFYSLQHKYWFRFTMWLTPMLLMPAILEISDTNTQWLAYLACVGMIVVGCFPDYTGDKFYYRGHVAGAVVTMVSSQLWVLFNCPLILLLWSFYIFGTLYYMIRELNKVEDITGRDVDWYDIKRVFEETKPLFWVEIFSLITTFLTILII